MKYANLHKGFFLERLNRFVARVEINGREERVHVKNTGRCAELLVPGNAVYLEKSDVLTRKTAYDLIAVEKQTPDGMRLVNMDSMAPNRAAAEWLSAGALEEDGVARFPDAPTERGVKHVRGLIQLAKQGCRCIVLIVIQMKGVHVFRPNWKTHPEFGQALVDAQSAGVEIIAMDCAVIPGEVRIECPVPVDLARGDRT